LCVDWEASYGVAIWICKHYSTQRPVEKKMAGQYSLRIKEMECPSSGTLKMTSTQV